MKEIVNDNELQELMESHKSFIIEFGLKEGCIPCKMTKENLLTFEEEKKYNVDYYFCSNVDVIAGRGYSAVPVVMLVTSNVKAELQDSGVSMDEEELSKWIDEELAK